MVRLGKGVRLGVGMYAWASPRTGKWDILVHLGEVVARLGEPLRLGKGRLHLGEGRLRLSEPAVV